MGTVILHMCVEFTFDAAEGSLDDAVVSVVLFLGTLD